MLESRPSHHLASLGCRVRDSRGSCDALGRRNGETAVGWKKGQMVVMFHRLQREAVGQGI